MTGLQRIWPSVYIIDVKKETICKGMSYTKVWNIYTSVSNSVTTASSEILSIIQRKSNRNLVRTLIDMDSTESFLCWFLVQRLRCACNQVLILYLWYQLHWVLWLWWMECWWNVHIRIWGEFVCWHPALT